jgi:hypothetical protein
MRLELIQASVLEGLGVPTVGKMRDLIVEHKDITKAIQAAGLRTLEWQIIALRDGRYVVIEAQDFILVLRSLSRLHADDFIYDGRWIP